MVKLSEQKQNREIYKYKSGRWHDLYDFYILILNKASEDEILFKKTVKFKKYSYKVIFYPG